MEFSFCKEHALNLEPPNRFSVVFGRPEVALRDNYTQRKILKAGLVPHIAVNCQKNIEIILCQLDQLTVFDAEPAEVRDVPNFKLGREESGRFGVDTFVEKNLQLRVLVAASASSRSTEDSRTTST